MGLGLPDFSSAFEARASYAIDILREIEKSSARIATERSLKSGRRFQSAKKLAIGALQYIYFEATGRRPTRRNDAYEGGKPYGPSLEFCKAALKPFWPDISTGAVDKLLRH